MNKLTKIYSYEYNLAPIYYSTPKLVQPKMKFKKGSYESQYSATIKLLYNIRKNNNYTLYNKKRFSE
jgi:hypothetical protein